MAEFTPAARTATRLAEADSVVVIGLGRFGSAVATELVAMGIEVLGIDSDEEYVQAHNGLLTHVVQADATNERALKQLAVPEFDRAVIGIGTNIEASLLATSLLVDFGVPQIWTKAISPAHGRILQQLGAHHVVSPEKEMGTRVAHLVRGAMLDFIEFDENFAMVKTTAPREALGKPLREAGLRARHGITVIAVKSAASEWTYATADTVLSEGDYIVVTGPTRKAERFALLG